MGIKLDVNFLTTRRGLIRIALIIIGLVITSMLCTNMGGGGSCFDEARFSAVSGANFVALIINIVFLVLAILSITNYSFERLFDLIAGVIFTIGAAVMIWYLIGDKFNHKTYFVPTILVTVEAVLFIYDWMILRGEA